MNAWKERKRDKTNLHKDQLGTVRAITDAAGVHSKQSVYKPFGTVTDWQLTEPPRVYRRVKLSQVGPYDTEKIHPDLHG